MKSEKEHLIHEVLDGESATRRAAVLRAGASVLRRRRWRQTAGRSLPIAALIVAIFALSWRRDPSSSSVSALPPPAPASSVRSLTDAELLALFPDTPVGLITLENGAKRLIFPRAGDEARFVKRL